MTIVSLPSNVLTVEGLCKSFGGVQAVQNVSFTVREGTVTGLIGPNGAGKSTVVSMISGFIKTDSGRTTLSGKDITNKLPHQIAKYGLVRTFQIAKELQRLTVFENLMLAPFGQLGENPWNALFARKKVLMEERRHLAEAVEWLKKFNLYDLRDEYAGNLSGGQKKLLELSRALMAKPKIVLLDEPMAGVNPTLTKTLQGYISDLRNEGTTFLLIEHNLSVVEAICDHVVVLAEGQVLAQGRMEELRETEAVVSAYLGG